MTCITIGTKVLIVICYNSTVHVLYDRFDHQTSHCSEKLILFHLLGHTLLNFFSAARSTAPLKTIAIKINANTDFLLLLCNN